MVARLADQAWSLHGIQSLAAEGHTVIDPNDLERLIAAGCEQIVDKRPLLGAFSEQVLVSVPVNRVATRSRCPNGERFPQSATALNARFLEGSRIDLDALDFSEVNDPHCELPFVWAPARAAA